MKAEIIVDIEREAWRGLKYGSGGKPAIERISWFLNEKCETADVDERGANGALCHRGQRVFKIAEPSLPAFGFAAAMNTPASAYKPLFKPFARVGKIVEKLNEQILKCLCD